ncbi:MAG: glycosyltransferase family 4 protein, partial [Rhabdochlamydiaceae bacterium]
MKIVFVSSLLPAGHYSQYLTNAISSQRDLQLTVYTDKNSRNLGVKNCGVIRTVWSKNYRFIFQIIRQVARDKPDVIHLQYEINMYGDLLTAILFPFLLLLLKIMNYETVVTIHAIVERSLIDEDFAWFFGKTSYSPLLIKFFFLFSYNLISFFSSALIVHSERMKDSLCRENKISSNHVAVIPHGVPTK